MNYLTSAFREILYIGALSTILVIMILVVKKLFGKILSPKWHYYIWMLLVIRLLIPTLPESSFSILNLYYYSVERLQVNEDTTGSPQNTPSFHNGDTVQTGTSQGKPDNNVTKSSDHTNTESITNGTFQERSMMETLTYVWLVGMILLTFYTLLINIIFHIKIRKTFTKAVNQRANNILEECKQMIGIKSNLSLWVTKDLRSPALYTSFHSGILITDSYLEQLTDREMKYIFLHELSHYKRKDILVNWVLTLLQIVYFFHPLVWYSFYKMHEDCEISCDAEALKYLEEEEHQGYGSTVIKLIKLFSESNFIPVTAGLWKHKSNYRRRIIMITNFKKYKWSNTVLTMILISALALTGLTGCKKAEVEASTGQGNTSITTTPIPTTAVTKTPLSNESATKTPSVKPEPSKAPEKEDTKGDKSPIFFGEWVISKVVAYGQVGTYSEEDTKKLIGKSLSFSKNSVTCFGDSPETLNQTAKNPIYEINDVSMTDFTADYRMTFEMLGLEGDRVTEVGAYDASGNGCTFLIKNDKSLILIGGGTYFELLRKAS